MKRSQLIITTILFFLCIPLSWSQVTQKVYSPYSVLSVEFSLDSEGEPGYTVYFSDSLILRKSKLGIIRTDADFSANLVLDSVSE